MCAISQGRVDQESREKLRDLWFPRPEKVKLRGVGKSLYAYRVGEGSNKGLSKKQFEVCYRHRWQQEAEGYKALDNGSVACCASQAKI